MFHEPSFAVSAMPGGCTPAGSTLVHAAGERRRPAGERRRPAARECWRAAGVSRCLSIVRVGSLVGSRSISMRFCVYVRLLTRRKKSEAVASWSSLAYLTSACEVQSNTQATDDAALWLWEAATCSDYQNQTCVKVVSHLGDASASRPGPTPRASPADAQSPEGPVTPLTLWRRHTSSSTAHSAQAP